MDKENLNIIPEEIIMNKIYLIRGKKVMIDRDLSELYGIQTKVLSKLLKEISNGFPKILCLK